MMEKKEENYSIDIINTRHIDIIDVNVDEYNTIVVLYSIHGNEEKIILENQDNRKYKEQIETLLLNTLNDKIFISLSKVEKSITERIKQAKKVDTDYANKD